MGWGFNRFETPPKRNTSPRPDHSFYIPQGITPLLLGVLTPCAQDAVEEIEMHAIEAKIKSGLRERGIICHSVFRMPDLDEPRVVIAFSSRENQRLTPSKVEKALNALGVGEFKAQDKFHRLSAAFLHLEVRFGARTERSIMTSAE